MSRCIDSFSDFDYFIKSLQIEEPMLPRKKNATFTGYGPSLALQMFDPFRCAYNLLYANGSFECNLYRFHLVDAYAYFFTASSYIIELFYIYFGLPLLMQ